MRVEEEQLEPCDMDRAIAQAADLLTDMGNEEYIRGMCELMARMFPSEGADTEERAQWFEAEVEKVLRANNSRQIQAVGNGTNVSLTTAQMRIMESFISEEADFGRLRVFESETRAVNALAQKGLLLRDDDGSHVQLTDKGRAWISGWKAAEQENERTTQRSRGQRPG